MGLDWQYAMDYHKTLLLLYVYKIRKWLEIFYQRELYALDLYLLYCTSFFLFKLLKNDKKETEKKERKAVKQQY